MVNMFDTSKIIEPHKGEHVAAAGEDIKNAQAAMIILHGRGATAESILTLSNEFPVEGFFYAAPQANQMTWYPYRFLTPIKDNEPGITSGLQMIDFIVNNLLDNGLKYEQIMILGFSQGGCLGLEYAARNPRKYGGVVGLSSALIGPDDTPRDYKGTFENTPVFLGCSDVDFHIPVHRVHEAAEVFQNMGADVTKKIYPGMGHNVNLDEIEQVINIMQSVKK